MYLIKCQKALIIDARESSDSAPSTGLSKKQLRLQRILENRRKRKAAKEKKRLRRLKDRFTTLKINKIKIILEINP